MTGLPQHGLAIRYDKGCRCPNCRTAHRRRLYRQRHPRQLPTADEQIAQLVAAGQLQPFVAPPCARCGRPLCNRAGQPRWDIVWPLAFVCLGSCPTRAGR